MTAAPDITPDQIERMLAAAEQQPKPKQAIDAVFSLAGLASKDIWVRPHSRKLARTRQVACYALRQRGWSFPAIAERMGYADHTSPLHACRVIEEKRKGGQAHG